MAFITYTPKASSALGERVSDPDNIIQIHAIHPAAMRHHHGLYRALMHEPGPLPRRLREILAMRVSALNRCRY